MKKLCHRLGSYANFFTFFTFDLRKLLRQEVKHVQLQNASPVPSIYLYILTLFRFLHRIYIFSQGVFTPQTFPPPVQNNACFDNYPF